MLTNKHLFTYFLYLSCFCCIAQKSYILQTVAFYNLENLFDTINQVDHLDELSPILEIKSGRTKIYRDKLSKLSTVLYHIGKPKNKLPPAIIGVVEVENKKVLTDLINTPPLSYHSYGIVHYNSPDQRGIDTALLYNKEVFTPLYSQPINAKIHKDNIPILTRDILWITGYLMDEKTHVLVNHWPSRRGGTQKSNVLREQAAAKCLEIVHQIKHENKLAKIIIMGDFNDNPTNKSLKKGLKTKALKRALNFDSLYNPFEKMFKKGSNTLVFRGEMFLFDQILFSENYLTKQQEDKGFKFYNAGVFNPHYLTVQSGKYKGSPKRSFSRGTYLGGYSDHYPVYTYLVNQIHE